MWPLSSVAVLGDQAAAMGLDDLLGDARGRGRNGCRISRRPAARSRSGRRSPSACPAGCRGLRRPPTTRTRSPSRAAAMRMRPPGGLKETALLMRLRQTCTSRPSMPCTTEALTGRRARAGCAASPSPAVASWRSTSARSMLAMSTGTISARDSSASRREASEMSLIRRSRRSHVVEDDAPSACFCCCGSSMRGDGLDGAAQRGQRILDLVGDVGGEALDGVHALPQRRGHVAQRAREIADLVAAAR